MVGQKINGTTQKIKWKSENMKETNMGFSCGSRRGERSVALSSPRHGKQNSFPLDLFLFSELGRNGLGCSEHEVFRRGSEEKEMGTKGVCLWLGRG